MRQSCLLKNVFYGLVFLLGSQHAWAEKITIEPIKSYTYPLPYRVADLDEYAANLAVAWQQDFDKCMAQAQGEDYWHCQRYRVVGKLPADYNTGFTNGEPNTYKLLLERYVDTKNYGGHTTFTEIVEGGAATALVCPGEFGRNTEGPVENRTVWCEKVKVESCLAKNPIDVYAGKKYEFEVDYVSPNGVLKVERQYVDQESGWIVNAEPRIRYVGAGESAPTEGLFHQTRAACIAPYEQTLTRLKATYDEPFVRETYTKLVCPEFNNRETVPVIYAWLNGKEYRLLETGGVYWPEGGFRGQLKVESVSDPAIPDAAWKMTHRDGSQSYFDSEGLVLKTFLPSGEYFVYLYTNGQLTGKTDQSGRSLSYVYNDKQRLESVVLPDSGVIEYDYVSHDDEQDVNYWLLAKVTWPDGASEEYVYNEPAHILGSSADTYLTGKLDAYGNRIGTYKYLVGKAISTEGFGGANKAEVTYRGYNYTRLKDGLGTQRTLYFQTQLADGQRLLTRELQPAGAGSASASKYIYYNSDGQITEKRDFNGNKIQYAYDPVLKFQTVEVKGIPASQWSTFTAEGVTLPLGATKTSTQWDATVSKPIRIAAPSKLTTFVYQGLPDPFNNDELANCTTATSGSDPLPVVCRKVEQATTDTNGQLGFSATLDATLDARHVLYTYNENGKMLTVQRSPDFANEVTVEYYQDATSTHAIGDIKRTQNALGHSVDYLEYDARGNPTKIQDANGVLTLLTYDARGRLQSQSVAGQTTTLAYDLIGNLTSITSADGSTLTREYDGVGRLSAVVDALLNRYEYGYDLEGNLLSNAIKDSSAQTLFSTSYQYDALSRLQKTLGNNGQSNAIAYDKNGNPLTETNALGHTTASKVDVLDRVEEVTDADNGKTTYTYDAYDRITSATDAEGKVTQYSYDAFGNLTSLTSVDTGVTTFTHDEVGNVVSKTDARNVTVTYTYDDLNRVTGITYSNAAENVTYGYDDTTNGNKGIGRLTSVTEPSGTTGYEYNALGEVTKVTQLINGQTYVTEYLFDASGRAAGVIYPSGVALSYAYDTLGQISGVDATINGQAQPLASSISYLPFGPVNSLTYGNGSVLTNSYDLDYRLTDSTLASLRQNSYSYSLTDNITAIDDVLAIETNQTFMYDVLDRLDIATGVYGSFDYGYDGVGNRLSKNADTYSYENSSKLQSIVGTETLTFAYDANGNTLQKGNLTFTYNQANRLATATDGAFNASYTYNVHGQRAVKIVDGVETHFIFDLSGKLIAEADANGTILREYVYFDDTPLAQIAGSDVYYYHNSHLGTPESMTDSAQAIVWRASYTPFGEASISTEVVENNVRFPGQYYDSETGLHYNWHRYYDPMLGRYMTSDPIGLQAGLNTFAYVGGNPIMFSDPSGLISFQQYYQCVQNAAAQSMLLFPDDARRHCFTSCEISCSCGLGTFGSAVVGVGKEVKDAFGPGNAEFRDLLNDAAGNICAESGTQEACKQNPLACGGPTGPCDCQSSCDFLFQKGELF